MPAATQHRYLIALGSNQRHPHHGGPRKVLAAALGAIEGMGIKVMRRGLVIETAPIGPSQRRYANSAAVIATDLDPPELLVALKQIEHEFGRRARGQRWRARVLDLDIVLWSGGPWASPGLTIPHPLFRERAFVLAPAASVAPGWRDPVIGLTVRQLATRLTGQRPLPRCAGVAGPVAQ